jgi:O-antigen/teichoic acid export membrane protein
MNRSEPRNPDLLLTLSSVTGVTVLTLGTYLIAVLFLGRKLSREDFGYFNLWVSALNVLGSISLLGFPNALVRNYPRDRLARSAWPRLGRPLAALTLLVCAIGTAIFDMIYHLNARDALWLFAASAFVGQTQHPTTVLQVFRRFSLAQGLQTLWRPLMLLGVLGLVATNRLGVPWMPPLIAVAGLLQLLISEWAARSAPRGPDAISLRDMWGDAMVFSGLYVAAILLTRLDSFFLAKLLDLDALGLYAALSFFTLTGYGVVAIAVGQVLRPKLASREHIGTRRLTWGLAVLGGAIGVVLALSSTWLVPAVFSSRYAGDHRVIVALLASAGLFQVLYAVPSSRIGVVSSTKSLRVFLPVSLSALVVDAVLLLWLVPRFGLAGAALASALTWLWRAASAWVVAGREK